MRVIQISFFVDPQRRPPERLLSDWHSLADIAVAVASAGVARHGRPSQLVPGEVVRDGVEFLFLPPDEPSGLLTRSARSRRVARSAPRRASCARPGVRARGARRCAASYRTCRFFFRIMRTARRVSGGAARGAAAQRVADGDLVLRARPGRAVSAVRSVGTRRRSYSRSPSPQPFLPGDRAAARAATGLHGDPAVLWVGHLDRNKDPLTVLEGVGEAARYLPGLQLWCCFGSAPLLGAVQARIAQDAVLRDRVHLLGRVPHEQVEQLMRAADLFVLGSHREGSSFSLIEALATGLTPVVTDIPSMRALTGNAATGALWPCGDARALSEALQAALAALGPQTRAATRAHFDQQLSSAAIGRKFERAYAALTTLRPVGAASLRTS